MDNLALIWAVLIQIYLGLCSASDISTTAVTYEIEESTITDDSLSLIEESVPYTTPEIDIDWKKFGFQELSIPSSQAHPWNFDYVKFRKEQEQQYKDQEALDELVHIQTEWKKDQKDFIKPKINFDADKYQKIVDSLKDFDSDDIKDIKPYVPSFNTKVNNNEVRAIALGIRLGAFVLVFLLAVLIALCTKFCCPNRSQTQRQGVTTEEEEMFAEPDDQKLFIVIAKSDR